MKLPKASEVFADELRERILTGQFAEGAGLPAERDLVTQTHLSRATVRESLRILEVQGLILIRSGRTGGAFVQLPGEEIIDSAASLLIRGRHIGLSALIETRQAVEPFCVQLAATNRTQKDIESLEEADRLMTDDNADLAQFLRADVDWHVGVARASHNELLYGLMSALSRAINTATDRESFFEPDARRGAVRAHSTITTAIRKGDGGAAIRQMKRLAQTR